MNIDNFVNDKIFQLVYFLNALLNKTIHYTEVDLFIWDTLEEWAQFNVNNEIPNHARERVFWHLIHELNLNSLATIDDNPDLLKEVNTCLHFLKGESSYPTHCIGWRPLI